MSQATNATLARWFVRGLAAVLTLSIVIETLPSKFWGVSTLKRYVSPLNNRLGLGQGEWPLFAPDPKINNAWISAELRGPDGSFQIWNSPYWATKGNWDKFRHFRMMNYGNRLPFRELIAGQDFADYLVNKEFHLDLQPVETEEDDLESKESAANKCMANESEANRIATAGPLQQAGAWKLDLYYNRLNISLPAEGGFPSRDDTTWISTSKKLLTREYKEYRP